MVGIANWRKTEVEELFNFCSPIAVLPRGQEWVLRFDSRLKRDLSVHIVSANEESSKFPIEVFVDS